MRRWSDLRLRVVISFVALGAVLGTLFAGAALLAAGYMERTFVETAVLEELEYFMAQVAANPAAVPPATTSFQGWHAPVSDLSTIPDWLRSLPPGLHELRREERWYEVAVADQRGRRVFLVYDESPIKRFRGMLAIFLGGAVLGTTYLAFWLGVSTVGRVVEPVTRLAARVRDLERVDAEPLAPEFGDDEVGELSRALDGYARRVRALLRRELELTADASHELRTGLATIGGTTELLLEMRELPTEARSRLHRIERAAADLRDLTEAFLLLAREPPAAVEPCRASPVLRQVVEERRELAERRGRPLRLEIEEDEILLPVPAQALAIVVGNLIDNALTHGRSGSVEVTLSRDEVVVTDQGPGVPAAELPRIFDRSFRGREAPAGGSGLGLTISRRLSEHFGGALTLETVSEGGATARLRFAS